MKISEDKKSVRLTLEGDYSAAQIETLISDLAEVRAQMAPRVRLDPDEPDNAPARRSVQEDPHVSVFLLPDERIQVGLRNEGLGWLIFNMSQQTACGIRDYLIANTPEDQSGVAFMRSQRGGGDTSH